MKNKSRFLSIIAAIVTFTIFGFSFMFSKIALSVTVPSVLLAARFTMSVLVMNLMVLVSRFVKEISGRELFHFSLKGKPRKSILLLGLFEPIAYYVFENYGILFTSSSLAGTVIAIVPVVCILMDVFIMHEKVSLKQIFCAVFCLFGVVLVDVGGEIAVSLIGIIFLLMAVLSDVLYYAYSKKVSRDYNPLETTYMMFLMGAVVFVPVAGIQSIGHFNELILPALKSGGFWMAVIYLGVISTIGAYSLLNYANRYLKASEASLFTNITTVVSVLAGIFLLDEPFSLFQIIGVIIILVFVSIANLSKNE